jgi:oligopeptidase A
MSTTITDYNPLLQRNGLPRFSDIKADHVIPGVRQTLSEAEAQLADLEAGLTATWDGLITPLEMLDRQFEYAWQTINHLMAVKNSDDLRKAHEAVLSDVVAFGLKLRQSRPIYDGLKAMQQSDAWAGFSEAQQRVVNLRLQEADHAGVGLDGEVKERFITIQKELSQLSTDFSNNSLDARKSFELLIENVSDAEGWPKTLREHAAQSYNMAKNSSEATPENGPWRITMDFPSYVPFMQHHRGRDQRELVYRTFFTLASDGEFDNTPLIDRILKLRGEMSDILGFSTFAELSLSEKMAPDVAAVDQMHEELASAAKPRAILDLEALEKFADDSELPLKHWDINFWAERQREQTFDFTDEQLRPYFPLPRVLDGMFSLCQKLFGITVKESNEAVSVWHEDVRFYNVFNEADEHIASFYLDPYSRPQEKRGGAWADNCFRRGYINGKLQLPVTHLTCNGTPPVGDRPSLMSFGEVLTLFHEFGHGLQNMLTTVDYADIAGFNGIEWDAVEIASTFMEYWCYHKPTLIGMTSHVETGEPLPDDLFEKIVASRTFRSGSFMAGQVRLGRTDMELHHRFNANGSETPFDVMDRITSELNPLGPLPGERHLCQFSHIFAGGYAAGYYSYKWSEVLSADAFDAFEEVGLGNDAAVSELGRKYRDTILAMGGSRPPMDVFKEFRGREPSTEPLLRHEGLLSNE